MINEGNSFARILEGLKKALEKDVTINVRMNIDKENLKEIKKLTTFLQEKGWLEKLKIDPQPVTSCPHWEDVIPQNDIFREVKDDVEFCKRFLTNYLLFERNSNKILGIDFKGAYCGAFVNMYVFCPSGDIYTCWDVIEDKKFAIGKYYPTFSLDEERLKYWHNRRVLNIPKCQDCKYALLCSGGCGVKSLYKDDTLYKGSCNNFDKLFEEVMKTSIEKGLLGSLT